MRESARRSSAEEEPADVSDTAPAAEPEPPAPSSPSAEQPRMRQSSMSVVSAVAAARIKAFQQQADEAKARDKLNAFKTKAPVATGPMVNSEEMHKETLKNKLKAFETAAKFKGTVEMKKTWRQVGAGRTYQSGTKVVAADGKTGVAPKKKITDLP